MVDIEKSIRDYLVGTTVYDLTAARVHANTSLPAGYTPADGPALLFAVRGGGQDYTSQVYAASVQFQAYAATPAECRALDRRLYEQLNDVKAGAILFARLEQLGQLLTEPQTDWPFVLSYYQIMVRND